MSSLPFVRPGVNIPGNDNVVKPAAIPDYFSAEECDRILALGEQLDEDSGAMGADAENSGYRKSNIRWLQPAEDTAWLFERLTAAIVNANQLFKFELAGFGEPLQVSSYGPGDHYDWHTDIGLGRSSSRKLTLSVQLSDSDAYEGGGLEFFKLRNQKIPRSRGSITFFPSYLVHRVNPITAGERWSLQAWIHGVPYR